jgi:glycosyltransferase involved in cell wall biosynthesis
MRAISFIVPAFNEAESVAAVVHDIKDHFPGEGIEILLVDDGSTDETAVRAEKAGAHVIRHSRNKGYGASLKTGIANARYEWVLFMDGDGQHKAEDALKLLAVAEGSDMVVGRRSRLIYRPFWRLPGKWLLGGMANYLSRRRIPDLNSGLRLIKRQVVLRYMSLCPNGFSFSTTITMILFRCGFEISYVPFEIKKRKGKSTVTLATGFETLLLVLRIATLIDPLRIFVPLSLFVGLVGIAWGIPYALMGNGISIGSMLAIVTAVLLFAIGLISDQISQMRLEKM